MACYITTDLQDNIGTIALNRPDKHHALSRALVDEIIEALAHFQQQQVRVVIVRAMAGSKVFSSGHDVDEIPLGGRDPLAWDDPLRSLIRTLENFPSPIIAMIEGNVWGGACEVVFACDMIVTAPDVAFAITPAKLGVPYNVSGMLTFINAVGPHIVKEMAFTAKPMRCQRLHQLGMVNHVVPVDELEAFTRELARGIAANAPLSVSVMKEQLRILGEAKPISPQGFERLQALRRVVYSSDDYAEGIRAFKEKRAPQFNGC